MKRKTLALFLVLAMVMTMVPTVVFAADEVMEQSALETAIAAAYDGENGGIATLTGNVTTESTIEITGTVTLDLAGFDIKASTTGYSVITVSGTGKLTLQDSGSTGTRYIKGIGSSAVISDNVPDGDGYVAVTGGVIYGGSTSSDGGGVYVDSEATFTMNSGTIAGNTADDKGGGVFVYGTSTLGDGGTFTMNGGTISNNTASSLYGGGGGVYIGDSYAKFTMTGGTIEYNKATLGSGGGVFNVGTMTMSETTGSSIIANNTAGTTGGGVQHNGGNTFTMDAGTIKDNTATTDGGGVYLSYGGDRRIFTMNGGTISGNTASTGSGGGVYVHKYNIMNMNGGTIQNNTADTNGGGVYVMFNTADDPTQMNIGNTKAITIKYNTVGVTTNNVELESNQTLTVDATPYTDSSIGITVGTETGTGDFTSAGAQADGVFTSDKSGYEVIEEGTSPYTYSIDLAPVAEVNGNKYTTVQAAINAAKTATGADTVTLLTDVTTTETITVTDTDGVTLDLAGYDITADTTDDDFSVITVGDGSTAANLTLTDSTTTRTHYGYWDAGVYTITDSTVGIGDDYDTLVGGIITGGTGTFYTNDTNNFLYGGGIYAKANSTFTMTGGNIAGNTALTDTGIYQAQGGGVYADGAVTLSGGTIAGNQATTGGGGVYVVSGRTFTLSSGSISNNMGGGVYVIGTNATTYGTFNMTGGTISGNTGSYGAGVHLYQYAQFNMSAGTIGGEGVGNTTTDAYGGGVYVRENCTFNMTGGTISYNSASPSGGGVYMNGTMNVSGAVTISDNTKGTTANNVYLPSGKTMTVTGDLDGSTIGITTATPATDLSPVTVAVGYDGDEDYILNETNDMVFFKDVSTAAGTLTFVEDEATNKIQLYVAHTHTWSGYSLGYVTDTDGNYLDADGETTDDPGEYVTDPTKIVASCSCGDTATLQIAAPTDLTYTGIAIEADITDDDGLQGDVDVVYYQADDEGAYGDAMSDSPTDVGTYKAELTVGGITITEEYTIEAKEVDAVWSVAESYTYTGVAQTHPTANYVDVDGSDVTLTVTIEVDKTFKDAATYTFTASETTDDPNYKLSDSTDTKDVTIAPATLTVEVSEDLTITKEYDGTDAVEGTVTLDVVGLQNSETASASGTWKYATTGASESITINITDIAITYDTADADNYTYTQAALTTTGAITDGDSTGTVGTGDGYTVDGDTITYGDTVTIQYTPELAVTNGIALNSLLSDDAASKTVELWYGEQQITLVNELTGVEEDQTVDIQFVVNSTNFTDSTDFNGTTEHAFTIKWGGDDNLSASTTTLSLKLEKAELTAAVDTTDASATKVYDGDADFEDVVLTLSGIVNSDTDITGTVDGTRASEDVDGSDVFAITADSVELDGTNAGYYTLDIADITPNTVAITKAPVAISLTGTVQTAGSVTGVTVSATPTVTYTVTYGDTTTQEVPTEVGTYAIYVVLTDTSNHYIAGTDEASIAAVQVGTLTITAEDVTVYEITGSVVESDGSTSVEGAVVTLKQGDTVFATAVTDASGNYSFSDVISGLYNIVAEADDVTMTIAATIDASEPVETIQMPSGNTNSVVEVNGAITPAVVVGGLSAVAEAEAGNEDPASIVNVVLTVEEKAEGDVPADSGLILAELTSDETVGMYLAIDITKTVDGGAETSITETNDVVQITIPLPEELQGKETYVVYRSHFNGVETVVNAITTTEVDGEKIVVSSDKTSITLYVKKFSTYALAYTEYTASSGSSGSSTYSSSVASTDNGDVSISSSKSTSGTKITITPDPDEGYEVGSVTVTYASGREVSVTDNGDGTYSYLQPGASVTVTVTFVAIGSETDSAFTDVDSDDSYYDAVMWAIENGITTGYADGSFNPYGITNRAQAVTFLWRAMGEPSYTIDNPFTDISEDNYFYDAVLWAFENGITVGTTDTTFSPYMDCSRAHIITFLWRMDGENVTNSINLFTDVKTTNYYYDAVLWGVDEGITTGVTSTTFQPKTDCTRVQIVTFLYRYLG